MTEKLTGLPGRLLLAAGSGLALGSLALAHRETWGSPVIGAVQSVRHLSGQVIFFIIPIIVLGFVTATIVRFGPQARRMLAVSGALSYGLVVVASLVTAVVARLVVPLLRVPGDVAAATPLPDLLFRVDLPPVVSPVTALTAAVLVGLGIVWSKAERMAALVVELNEVARTLCKRVIVATVPFLTFGVSAVVAFEGRLTAQAGYLLQVGALVVAVQVAWLVAMFTASSVYSRTSPRVVLRHYLEPLLTALTTASSAAAAPTAMRALSSSPTLDKPVVGFSIPVFAHIHLPGTVIGVTLLTSAFSQAVYGTLPPLGASVAFAFLLALLTVAAPGVPGGAVPAAVAAVGAVLGHTDVSLGLIAASVVVLDAFATATNIVSDGALVQALHAYRTRRAARAAATAEPVPA